jgi:hypothetical protein
VVGRPIEAKLVVEGGDAVTDVAGNAQLGLDFGEDLCRQVPQPMLDSPKNGQQRFARTGGLS